MDVKLRFLLYRIADSRAPRDGKFTEKIGTYNPNTNPATVDFELSNVPCTGCW